MQPILSALAKYLLSLLACVMQARDVQRREEQAHSAAILREQLEERRQQRLREEEMRDQVCVKVVHATSAAVVVSLAMVLEQAAM